MNSKLKTTKYTEDILLISIDVLSNTDETVVVQAYARGGSV